MPPYYSGTNCLATGIASTDNTPNEYVTDDWLYINGTLVKEDHGRTDHYSPANLSCIFDSTHFADGSIITIQMSARSNLGNSNSASASAVIYNRAYVLGNTLMDPVATDVVQYIDARASAMNHSVRSQTNEEKATILGEIPYRSAFFSWTHGSPGLLGDCKAVKEPFNPTHYLYAIDTDPQPSPTIADEVALKGLTEAPYNFVHLHICNGAGGDSGPDDSLANGFGIADGVIDRAFLSYTTLVLVIADYHNVNWCNNVWQGLQDGDTLQSALAYADSFGTVDRDTTNDHLAVWRTVGDGQMKLHGVYGGVGLQWYR